MVYLQNNGDLYLGSAHIVERMDNHVIAILDGDKLYNYFIVLQGD